MKTKIAAALVAALTIGTVAVSATSQAQAHQFHRWGWGWGGLGLTAASTYYAYAPCYLAPHYNRYGRFIGNVRVCY